jgi:prepilin-type N-terminal cleavage/methylation domain-containing protein
MHYMNGRPARDDGVTLIEVLIVVVLLGVIVAPLTGAIIVFIRNTNETTNRMAESHDAQIAAAYFAQDVQSIGVRDWSAPPYPGVQSIELNAPAAGGLYPCGTGSAALVRLAWDDPAVGAPSVRRVSYVVQTIGSERQLHRIACNGAGAVSSDVVLAHNVDTATAPTVACANTAGAAQACDTSVPPAKVTMTLTIRAPANSTSYVITLVGQRRQT